MKPQTLSRDSARSQRAGVPFGLKKGGRWHVPMPGRLDLSLMARGIAALIVVWWHVTGYQAEGFDFLRVPGRTAVWVFFLISGYVIGSGFASRRYPFTAGGVRTFYLRRILRVYPLFLFISVLAIFTALAVGMDIETSMSRLIFQLVPIQWAHQYDLVGVFWTIGVELQFYLAAPIFIYAICRYRHKYIYLSLAYVVLLLWPLFAHKVFGTSIDNRTAIGNFAHFFVGMAVAANREDLLHFNPRAAHMVILAVLAATLLAASNDIYNSTLGGARFYSVGPLLVDGAGLILLALHVWGERKVYHSPPALIVVLYWFGVLSYGVYAWHGYLLTFFPYLSDRLAMTVAGSTVLAYFSYVLIEKPALSMGRTAR